MLEVRRILHIKSRNGKRCPLCGAAGLGDYHGVYRMPISTIAVAHFLAFLVKFK